MPFFTARRLTFFLYFFFIFISSVNSQTFPLRVYNIDDGLATNIVNDAIQDNFGRIWVATEIGVSVYDASSWKNYSSEDNLSQCEYISINKDSLGYIWALPSDFNKNICYFNGKSWISLPQCKILKFGSYFTSFAINNNEKNQEILVGSSEGVFSFAGKKWIKITDPDKKLDCDIFSIRFFKGNFYIASQNGLFIYNGKNHFRNLTSKSQLETNEILAIDLAVNPISHNKNQNVCWILTKNVLGFLDLSTNIFNKVRNTYPVKFIQRNKFHFIKYDNRQRIYYGNDINKFSLDLKSNENLRLGMDNGFSTTGNTNIFIDREESVWFLSSRGIDKLSNSFFTHYSRSTGLKENEVTTILEIKPGEYFLGHNYGFTIFSSKSSKYYGIENKTSNEASNCRIMDAAKDKWGNIWFSASFQGIGKLSAGGSVRWYTVKQPVQFGAVIINKNGIPFFGSTLGLFTLKNEKLELIQHQREDQTISRKLYLSGSSIIYSPSKTGLYEYNSMGILKNVITDQKRSNNYYGMCEYNGNLLIGSEDGLFILRNNRFEEYSLGYHNIHQKVFFIGTDIRRNLWLGTDDGVLKWDGTNLRKLNKDNGLLGRETNRSGFCADSNGKIWIGTERGLSCYFPEYDIARPAPYLSGIHITDLNRNQYPLEREVELSYNQNTFHLHFKAISFLNEEKMQYRVRLIGLAYDDVEYSSKNSVRYNNLPSGKYYFQIEVQNINEEWSKIYKTSFFYINPPFYMTWWFILLAISLTGSIVYWVYTYIYQVKYNAQLSKEVSIRTSELLNSEQKIRSLIENTPYQMMMIDKGYKITYLNRSELPFSKEYSIDVCISDYFNSPAHELIIEKLDNLFHQKLPFSFEYNFRPIIGKDLWMDCHFSPIINNIEVDEAVAIFIDRTELKQAELESHILKRNGKKHLQCFKILWEKKRYFLRKFTIE